MNPTTLYYVAAQELAFFVSLAIRIGANIVSIVAGEDIADFKATISHFNNANYQQFQDYFSAVGDELEEQIVFEDDAPIDADPLGGEEYPINRPTSSGCSYANFCGVIHYQDYL